jgi:tetratricopeptide (TPR) repeat protein
VPLGYIGGFTSDSKLKQTGNLADPKDKIILYNRIKMAEGASSNREYDEAIAGFDRIVQIDSRDPKPRVNLGAIYTEIKEYDNAIAHLEQAIAIDPEHNAMAHNLLGAVYLEKKMLEQAEEELRIALKMRPRISDAHYNLGLLNEEKGNLNEAMEEYKKEIEIHPRAYPAHFNLALLYRKMGLLQDQVRELRKAIDSNKKYARAYLFLAKAYCDLNENYDEAMSLVKKGLELDPEADSAPLGHYVLADIYNRLGRHKDYSSELQKGKLLEKKNKSKKK